MVVSMTAPGCSLMPMIRSIGVLFLGACLVLAYQVQEFLAVRLDKWPLETHVTGRQLVTNSVTRRAARLLGTYGTRSPLPAAGVKHRVAVRTTVGSRSLRGNL